jgi:eukaryotic-like serine/threonine-protein kinase
MHLYPPTTTSRSDWRISGRYRIEDVVGRGGMSTVYRATDTVLDRTVAVKVLLPALAEEDPANIARLQREARAAAALRHRSVVRIYDTGSDDATHFIVMEYVAGQGLEAVIRERGLDAGEAAGISAEIADAVAAAHAVGVLHRDIKPANVILTPDGGVKVLDFGIAHTARETTITQPAFAIGTAAYMPPERVAGRAGDERSDIYSLGCLLYALLTGRPPFVGDHAVAILHQQVHADPVPLRKAGARVPPGLERLVMWMLAKDPADRPQSAAEVAQLLALAAGGVGGAGAARRAMVIPSAAPRRARRLRLPAIALASAVGLALALSALGGTGAKPAASHRPPASLPRIGAEVGEATRTPTTKEPGAAVYATTTSVATSAAPPPPRGRGRTLRPPNPLKPGKPPKPPKPPKDSHLPPGHGGVPPGQAGDGGD